MAVYLRLAYTSCVGWRNCIQVPSAPFPLPKRSSAPKLSRMKINLSNVRWLRTSQGAMQAKKIAAATTTPLSDGLYFFARRYHAHNPEAGKNATSTVLASAASPQSSPNASHGFRPSRSSMVSVSQKRLVSRSAEKLVSHTQRVHQNIT